MKKLYAIVIFLSLAVYVSGQTYLSEDFSSGLMPPTGWSIDNLPGQWSVSNSNNAGGTAPEGMFTYINKNTTSRLISPTVDLTGITTVTLMFSHYYDIYTTPVPKIGVATRHGSGSWNSVWELQTTTSVGPQTLVLTIMNTDVGHSDFQFCFYLTGNLYNMNYWYLDDILLYTPPALDLDLASITMPQFTALGDNVFLAGKVKNMGANNITSFDVAYSIDGGASQVYSFTGLNMVIGDSYSFTDSVPMIFNTTGYHGVAVKIQNINGGNDNNPANDTLSGTVGVVPEAPDKKVFCEEATGTWCGWCVRGICFMNYMAETYPDTWLGVAVHNGDPMVDTPYDAAIPDIIPNFPGYPSGTIDRAGGNYWDPSDFETGYLQRMKVVRPASVRIVNFAYDAGSLTVDFDVESDILIDISHELRFCAVISEDSVYGTTSGYNQANYYSDGSNGPMCGFENLPNPIPAAQMHYDHVARLILDTPYGTTGSVPVPAVGGNTYSHHYTYTLPSTWRYDKLHFIGLLMDHTTGEILNANDVLIWLGAKQQNQEIKLSVYPNPFSNAANVSFTLQKSTEISLKAVDLLGKVVYQENPKTYPSGENKIVLDGKYFNNGIYIVELLAGNKSYTQKISVMK